MPPNRPLNAVEQTIHKTATSNEKKIITQKEIDALVADVNVRAGAINFLLATGMLKMMQGDEISYKAVAKKEMEIKKEMTGDERMVLSHIEAASDRGIWTKHLKAKTELHQTVITRCIKSLEQKGLIKAVDSVEHPTRKMYMMAHLQPAVEVSGGPWYSDKELDTEFIKMLSSACLRFIQEKTFPKQAMKDDEFGNNFNAPLYPVSHSTSYPTAKTIHTWLQKSKLSEQELNVKHVEMLLDVLIYDGQIERLPAYGASMWDMTGIDEESDEDDIQSKRRDKTRKVKGKEKKKKDKGRKRPWKDTSSEEVESEDDKSRKSRRKVREESDASDEERPRKSQKRRRVTDSESSGVSQSESESELERKKRKKKRKLSSSKSAKTSKKSRSKKHRGDSDRSDTESDSDHSDDSSDSDSDNKTRPKRQQAKSRKDKEHGDMGFDALNDGAESTYNSVYRAIRQDRVSLGWSQAPCARCPVFEFCHEDGPVNPKECVYYGDWLRQGIAGF